MDKRRYDKDMVGKMYDIIELTYILNKLTNEFYEDDYSKQYLIDMMGSIENVKYNIDKYRGKGCYKQECNYCSKKNGFIDKIIFYLKSLNEG